MATITDIEAIAREALTDINQRLPFVYNERAQNLANAVLELCERLRIDDACWTSEIVLKERALKERDEWKAKAEKSMQFCRWLAEDSKKYPGTDAGIAARRLLRDLERPPNT